LHLSYGACEGSWQHYPYCAADLTHNFNQEEQSDLPIRRVLHAADRSIAADIVTQIDQAVENFMCKRLTKRYPTFAFIGEETYNAGVAITDQPTFIVDPIDGTSNFVHAFPEVCVSIGLVIEKEPTIGVVYNPFREELWSAVKGHGAFTWRPNGEMQKLPLVSAPLYGLGPACIGIEWGSDREGPNFELNLKVFTTLARTAATGGRFVNSLWCTGSAAITICRIAAGQQDAFWECGCWAWDVAAAWCILTEAGGIIVDGHPGEWNPPINNRRYLAVRPATGGQREFVEEFWSVIGDDRSTYGPAN
jgi:myo-inositol-1(or 4)-monophosphatase